MSYSSTLGSLHGGDQVLFGRGPVPKRKKKNQQPQQAQKTQETQKTRQNSKNRAAQQTDGTSPVEEAPRELTLAEKNAAAQAKSGVVVNYTLADYEADTGKLKTEINRINNQNWGSWLNNPAGQIEKQAQLQAVWLKQQQVQLKLINELMRGVRQYLPEPSRSDVLNYIKSPDGFAKDYKNYKDPGLVWLRLSTLVGFPVVKHFQTLAEQIKNLSIEDLDTRIGDMDVDIRKRESDIEDRQAELTPKEEGLTDEEKEKARKRRKELAAMSDRDRKIALEKERKEREEKLREIEWDKQQLAHLKAERNDLLFIRPLKNFVDRTLNEVPQLTPDQIESGFNHLKAGYNKVAPEGKKLVAIETPINQGSMRAGFIATTEGGDKVVVKLNRPDVVAAVNGLALEPGDPNNYLEQYKRFAEFLLTFKTGLDMQAEVQHGVEKHIEAYRQEVNPYGEQEFVTRLNKHLAAVTGGAVKTPEVLFLDAVGSVESFMPGQALAKASKQEKVAAIHAMGPSLLMSLMGIWDTVYGDPHEGNLMSTPGILDFGRVGILNKQAHQSLTTLYREYLKYVGDNPFYASLYGPGYNAKLFEQQAGQPNGWQTKFVGERPGNMEGEARWRMVKGQARLEVDETQTLKAIRNLGNGIDKYRALELLNEQIFTDKKTVMDQEEEKTDAMVSAGHGTAMAHMPDYLMYILRSMVRLSDEKVINPISEEGQRISEADVRHAWSKLRKVMPYYFEYEDQENLKADALGKELDGLDAQSFQQLLFFRIPEMGFILNHFRRSDGQMAPYAFNHGWFHVKLDYSKPEQMAFKGIQQDVKYVLKHMFEKSAEVQNRELMIKAKRGEEKSFDKKIEAESKELTETEEEYAKARADKRNTLSEEDRRAFEQEIRQINSNLAYLDQERHKVRQKIAELEEKSAKAAEAFKREVKKLSQEVKYQPARAYLTKLLRARKNMTTLTDQIFDELFKKQSISQTDRKKARFNLEHELYKILKPADWIDAEMFGMAA
ncbi:MAG: hypothetical protein KC476_05245 [Cyanobacteria bacterium HKST-UBA06]|nr:hypothetical protein [Cyanobacteria bacterium HKST-UBA06]